MRRLIIFVVSLIVVSVYLTGCSGSSSQRKKEVKTVSVDKNRKNPPVVASSDARFSDYRLGSGDLISVQVFGEAEMSIAQARLSDAGTISYPFLGELNLLDMTVSQVEQFIQQRLNGDYLIDPKVNVTVLEYRQFYMNGEVRSPGGFPFRPGLTVQKALALAGGLTDRASSRSFTVISEGDPRPRTVGLNYVVKPGDIITVGESFF